MGTASMKAIPRIIVERNSLESSGWRAIDSHVVETTLEFPYAAPNADPTIAKPAAIKFIIFSSY